MNTSPTYHLPPLAQRWYEQIQANPAQWWDNVMQIYTFKPVLPPAHAAVVKAMFVSGTQQAPRVVAPHQLSVRAVQRSLMYRYPVYFGRPQRDLYDISELRRVLDYTPELAPSSTRYAVVGQAFIGRREIRVAHTWGVNLETQDTADYKAMVQRGRITQRGAYRHAVRTSIRAAVLGCVMSHTRKNTVIRMPALGLGVFMNAVQPEERLFAAQTFVDAVHSAWLKLPDRQHVRIELALHTALPEGVEWPDDVVQDTAAPWNNLFHIRSQHWRRNTMVCMVNAWDNAAFIGNGMTRDHTIDGWLVAGHGPGAAIANTSYLHNVFMSPQMLDPAYWIRF
jgi:hypothetical protein